MCHVRTATRPHSPGEPRGSRGSELGIPGPTICSGIQDCGRSRHAHFPSHVLGCLLVRADIARHSEEHLSSAVRAGQLDRRQGDCESESISVQRWALCMTKKPCEASKPNATGSKSAIVCVRSIINPSGFSLALQAGISPQGPSSRTSTAMRVVFCSLYFVAKSEH